MLIKSDTSTPLSITNTRMELKSVLIDMKEKIELRIIGREMHLNSMRTCPDESYEAINQATKGLDVVKQGLSSCQSFIANIEQAVKQVLIEFHSKLGAVSYIDDDKGDGSLEIPESFTITNMNFKNLIQHVPALNNSYVWGCLGSLVHGDLDVPLNIGVDGSMIKALLRFDPRNGECRYFGNYVLRDKSREPAQRGCTYLQGKTVEVGIKGNMKQIYRQMGVLDDDGVFNGKIDYLDNSYFIGSAKNNVPWKGRLFFSNGNYEYLGDFDENGLFHGDLCQRYHESGAKYVGMIEHGEEKMNKGKTSIPDEKSQTPRVKKQPVWRSTTDEYGNLKVVNKICDFTYQKKVKVFPDYKVRHLLISEEEINAVVGEGAWLTSKNIDIYRCNLKEEITKNNLSSKFADFIECPSVLLLGESMFAGFTAEHFTKQDNRHYLDSNNNKESVAPDRQAFKGAGNTIFDRYTRVVFPINMHNSHWVLGSISLQQDKLVISVLDSMQIQVTYTTNIAPELLQAIYAMYVAEVKHKVPVNQQAKYLDKVVEFAHEKVAQQNDGHSCGAFVCGFMKALIENKSLEQIDPVDIRKDMLQMLLPSKPSEELLLYIETARDKPKKYKIKIINENSFKSPPQPPLANAQRERSKITEESVDNSKISAPNSSYQFFYGVKDQTNITSGEPPIDFIKNTHPDVNYVYQPTSITIAPLHLTKQPYTLLKNGLKIIEEEGDDRSSDLQHSTVPYNSVVIDEPVIKILPGSFFSEKKESKEPPKVADDYKCVNGKVKLKILESGGFVGEVLKRKAIGNVCRKKDNKNNSSLAKPK